MDISAALLHFAFLRPDHFPGRKRKCVKEGVEIEKFRCHVAFCPHVSVEYVKIEKENDCPIELLVNFQVKKLEMIMSENIFP